MLDLVTICLGGRAAERVVLDDISTGASGDLQTATSIARRMVTEFGMSDVIGPVTYGGRHEEVFVGRDWVSQRNFSENVAALVDGEVKGIVEGGYTKATELLKENIDILHRLASVLTEVETLTAEEFETVFQDKPLAKLDEIRAMGENGKPEAETQETDDTPKGIDITVDDDFKA